MTVMTQQILEQALRLPQDERLAVARTLLKSVETRMPQTAASSASPSKEETAEGSTFSQRWRGKFVAADRDDERYKALAQRYL